MTVKELDFSDSFNSMDESGNTLHHLSSRQMGLWLYQQKHAESCLYNVCCSFLIQSKAGREVIGSLARRVYDLHPAFRTRFTLEKGLPKQHILPEWQGDVNYYCRDDAITLEEQAEALNNQAFDINGEVYCRLNVICCEEDTYMVQYSMHHVLGDAKTGYIIGNTLSDLIVSYFKDLPEPVMTYSTEQYISAILAYDQKNDVAEQYWKNYLTDVPLGLDLSHIPMNSNADNHDQQELEDLKKTVEFSVDAELMEGVTKLVKQNRSTMFCFFSAIYGILLGRCFRSEKFAIGYVRDVRRTEDKEILGYFIEKLPLVLDVQASATISQLIKGVSTDLRAHKKIGNIASAKIFELFGAGGESMSNALNFGIGQTVFGGFDVKKELQETSCQVTPYKTSVGDTTSVFSFIIDTSGKSGRFRFNYDSSIFSEHTVASLQEALKVLIAQAVAAPEKSVNDYELVSDAQYQQMAQGIEFQPCQYPHYDNIAQVFSERVESGPDLIAVIEEEQKFTYSDIDKMSNVVANLLKSKGLGAGDQVGVCMNRSGVFFASMLGILKLGATYIPLVPKLPHKRIQSIIDDSQLTTVLTRSEFADKFGDAINTEIVDQYFENPTDALLEPVEVCTQTEVAIVLYTSGSTGNPKGVELYHRGMLNTLQYYYDKFPTNNDGVVLCRSSLTFDVSIMELFGGFMGGNGALFMLPTERELDFRYLVRAINDFKITHAIFVPSLLKPILEQLHRDDQQPHFPAMRSMVVGGEKFPAALCKQLQQFQFDHITIENHYGPTETSIYTCALNVNDWDKQAANLPVGKAIHNVRQYVLDDQLRLLPPGIIGEVCVGGVGVNKGYRNLPEKTAQAFTDNPYIGLPYDKLYRTGDWGRILPDGNLDILGRFDEQVKLRGQRIELVEIESAAAQIDGISSAVALVKETDIGEMLVMYYSLGATIVAETFINNHLVDLLPSYMVPQRYIKIENMPLLINGKIDRKSLLALPLDPLKQKSKTTVEPTVHKTTSNVSLPDIQSKLVSIWQSVLRTSQVTITDNFFEVGGHSLLIIEIVRRVEDELGIEMSITDFFRYPNIKELAEFLAPESALNEVSIVSSVVKHEIHEIAVIGIACRFPEAPNKNVFWQNLLDGKESISTFSDTELFEAGEKPVDFEQPSYVRRRGLLDDAAAFDNDIFNYTPREAELIDPQQRLFLQEAYHALEDAGYGNTTQTQHIGVYGGAGFNDYAESVRHHARENKGISFYQVMTGNANDFLCTRVAYKLNLSGPAINVQTACSTSLVSVERACRDLRNGLCDMALAGGVSLVGGLEHTGYKYQNGMILSPDGHCRSFDAKAEGTVPSQGVGVVLLKPLQKAMEDGDNIYAVVKGVATNNDGKAKVGFTAPDVKGQSQVIRQAHEDAGVTPHDISYIEAHGTGTPMGDPIEIAALSNIWHSAVLEPNTGEGNPAIDSVQLGSVKSNLGHTDAAAGIAGFIKTALCLHHRQLVPTLHFEQPNAELHLDETPFSVNTEARCWDVPEQKKRCAGVSAFGIGGTNAHVILEEAPECHQANIDKFDAIQLLPVSAICMDSLDLESSALIEMLAQSSKQHWHSICYTAQVGRQAYTNRACYVLQQKTAQHDIEAVTLLNNAENPFNNVNQISFCFHGVVSQALAEHYFALYQHCFLYADLVNDILDEFGHQLGISLKPFFAGTAQMDWMNWGLERALLGFAAELGYAKLLAQAGVELVSVIGNGGGELTASCFAGAIDIKAVVNVLVRQQTDISVQVSLDKPEKPLYLSSAQTWLIGSAASDVVFTRTEGAKNHINIDQVFEIADPSLPNVEAVLSFVNGDLFGAKTKTELDLFSFSTHQELYDLGATLYAMLGYWWLAGQSVNWMVLYPFGSPNRVSMPGYAFEKKTFYIPAAAKQDKANDNQVSTSAPEVTEAMTPEYLERIITQIWCEHLNLPSISLDDDFFEIGGESLMAIGVFEDLEHTLNVKLSVSSLYQASTLRLFLKLVEREVDFVSHIDEHTEQHHEQHHDTQTAEIQDVAPLVLLQEGSDTELEPIFLIHAAGGGLIHFNTLIKSLGERYTVYGFEAPSLMTFDSIESLAKCYLDALLEAFPVQESFIIGGHSFGPLVALEMGHQLNRLGKNIEKLLLIDPPGPEKMPIKARFYSQILVHLCDGQMALDEDYMRYLSLEEQINYMRRQAGETVWKQHFYYITPAYIRRFKQQMDMMFEYEFKPLACDSIYFTPTENMPLLPKDMYESWYKLTQGDMQVIPTPGNHINMVLSPGAQTIADALRSGL